METSSAPFWLDPVVYYDSSGSEAEEVKECLVSHSDSDSDTSDAGSSDEETDHTDSSKNNTLPSHVGCFLGRNKYQWFKEAPSRPGPAQKPTIHTSVNLSENDEDVMSIWNKLFNNEILEEIFKWTNVKLAKSRAAATQGKDDLHDLDMTELLCFVGVLVYSALFKSNDADADFIFATDGTARDIFKCVMSKARFVNLLKCVRISDPDNKDARGKKSNFAAISKIFQIFVNNCQSLYNAGQYLAVDEALIPFKEPPCLTLHRRKCAKQSFQIMCLCDAKNGYFCNGYIYKGKDSETEGMTEDEKMYSVSTRSVLRLSRPMHGTGRNVTCGKGFTSIELIEALEKNGLSCVGAVTKSLRELPKCFLPSRARPEGSTLYAFTNQITLVSHVPRRGQAVIIASSMHHEQDKTEVIPCYESTKEAVAKIDKKRGMYSCGRHTRRGSLAVLFWILDISIINAHIAYVIYQRKKVRREDFIKDLGRCLVLKKLQRRVHDSQLPLDVRRTISRVLGPDMPGSPDGDEVAKTRKTCYTCPPNLKRKSSYQCYVCHKHVCSECARHVCRDCAL